MQRPSAVYCVCVCVCVHGSGGCSGWSWYLWVSYRVVYCLCRIEVPLMAYSLIRDSTHGCGLTVCESRLRTDDYQSLPSYPIMMSPNSVGRPALQKSSWATTKVCIEAMSYQAVTSAPSASPNTLSFLTPQPSFLPYSSSVTTRPESP
jgi:hypothetical protein